MGQALAAVGTLASVAGAVGGARAQSAAYRAQAAEQDRAARLSMTRAKQEEAQRREELASTMGTIAAVRAGRGLSQTSPTGIAAANAIRSDAMSDLVTERENSIMQSDAMRRQAAMNRSMASSVRTAGYLNAAGSLLRFGASQYEK